MSSHKPVITAWHIYRIDTASAEVVVLGSGFGDLTGSVKVNIKGGGVVVAPIKSWSSGSIVASVPVNSTIQRVHVYTIDERGKNKQSAQSPAGETRNSNGAAAPWTVTATDDNVDHIVVDGTGLGGIVDVALYDSSVPQRIYDASFLLDDGTLYVDWPASFVGPITEIRLSDAGGNHVSETAGSWTPDPNGVIIDASVQDSTLNLIGSGFGVDEGAVRLAEVGGALMPATIVSNGWSDTLVQVIVEPGASYDQIELTREDGEVSTVDPGVAFPIVVPGGTPIITDVQFYDGRVHIVGNGLMQLDGNLDVQITTDETPGTFMWQPGIFVDYIGTSYESCGNLESKTNTLITLKPMQHVIPAQVLASKTYLNGVPAFSIVSVGAYAAGVYSGPYTASYTPPSPVDVSWTPIDQSGYPAVTGATHSGTIVTLTGTNFDAIPRSQAAGVVFHDAVNGPVASVEMLTGSGRLVSATDTEMQWDLASWSTSNGNGLLDVLTRVDLFTTECDYTEHVLGSPMTFQ